MLQQVLAIEKLSLITNGKHLQIEVFSKKAFMISRFFQNLFDLWFCIYPQKLPSLDQFKEVRLIAHRGAHSKDVKENTLAAFKLCLNKNVWGIEFDIRWTKDNVPVVHHDVHCGRVFNRANLIINDNTFETLRNQIPEVPTLDEVIVLASKKLHLLIELKTELTSDQEKILAQKLSKLTSVEDYHLLSLSPQILKNIHFEKSDSLVGVALTNTVEISENAIENQWGAIAGHYFLINNSLLNLHKKQGQIVGVGYICSKNSLYREINRGISWIFTNHALRVEKWLV